MSNSNLEGKWTEIKGEIKTMWGNLTGDELESTKGNLESIVGLIQQKYGAAKDDVSERVKAVFGKYEHKANVKTEQTKDKLRN
jgi:uncharacterized protein YjbJ (UPF0337 family)